MSSKIVYLVSGSNRGIGKGLVDALAQRPNAIVFAGARDPSAASLKELAAKHPNVYPVKMVLNDKESNEAAAAYIEKTAGQLDVVIANAGIGKSFGPVSATPISEFQEHYEANTLGMIVLWQAVHKLVVASPTGAPVFAYISTNAGSIGAFRNFNSPTYGHSKAAANYLVKSLDAESSNLVAMAIHPGWVQTEMGNGAATSNGMPAAPYTLDECVSGILGRIDGATREKSGGKFWNAVPKSGDPWDIPTDEVLW
ncbi:aflatoxin biosynthesis ketoreductase-like protein nor-1 [Roridomyces roridus]|uniref:Aflatoxin biosynthesis ketoreductase-like protein nor-1 n=1 Tax=Roridomyces roridus TaxID=1738132 RepID=A0AAD7BCS0_9AGAR|nr:aflatoxin biosynthesis ketoreductase-like protein nor-1 [Roridomyces roridus]